MAPKRRDCFGRTHILAIRYGRGTAQASEHVVLDSAGREQCGARSAMGMSPSRQTAGTIHSGRLTAAGDPFEPAARRRKRFQDHAIELGHSFQDGRFMDRVTRW